MIDPFKKLSLATVFFILFLFVLLWGTTSRVFGATLYSQSVIDGNQVSTGYATGYQLSGTSACVERVDLKFMRIGTPTSTFWANLLYGSDPNTPMGVIRTSTNSYTMDTISNSAATTTSFYFNPCFEVPAYEKAWVIFNAENKTGLTTAVDTIATMFGWGGVYPGLTQNGVGNVNSSTLPAQIWFGEGEGIATGNENVEFRFPTDGMETPDFSSWVLSANGMNEDMTYWFNVSAYLATSTVSSSENGTTFTDISSFTGASSTNFWTVLKSESLTPGMNDGIRYWIITAKLCGEAYCFIPLDTEEIVITTNFTSTIPDTPYTGLAGPFHNPDDYLYSASGKKLTREQVTRFQEGKWCTDPEGWVDALGYAFCRVAEILLKPNEEDYSAIGNAFDNVKKIYPFKYGWDIIDNAKGNAILTDTTLSPTLTLDMRTAFANDTATVTLLSSSTLSNLVGSEQTSNIKTTERYVIWTLVIGLILKTLLI